MVSPSQDLLFMAYTIEKDSESESESSDDDEAEGGRRLNRLSSSEGSEEGSCSDG